MHRPPATIRVAIAPAAIAAVLAGCAPQAATAEGAQVKMLYDFFLVVAAGVFVIVAGLIGWSILRYRDTGDGREPAQTQPNTRLELIWWAIPTLLVIILFILTAQVLGRVDERTDDPAVTVDVTGFQ